MAIIKASCPECGDVQLTSQDVSCRLKAETNEGSYSFRCPECRISVCKSAEQRILDLLVNSGVDLFVMERPKELDEHPFSNPPFTYDDLLDFHNELEAMPKCEEHS